MIDRAVMPGVLKSLDELKAKGVPMYVASGAPHEELHEICGQIGLKDYFIDIFGAPNSKAWVIKRAFETHKVSLKQILMIGDSMTDWHAAHMTQCTFLGVRSQYTIFPEGTELCDGVAAVLRKI